MAEQDNPDSTPESKEALPPANEVIKAFGGLRPMASKLGIAVSTVQGWASRDHIPENRHEKIREAAKEHGIVLKAPEGEARDGKTEAQGKSGGQTKSEPGGAAAPSSAPSSAPSPSSSASKPAESAARRGGSSVPSSSAKSASAKSSAAASSAPTAKADHSLAPGMILGALLVLIGVVIAVVAEPIWEPWIGGANQGDGETLSRIEDRLAALENQPPPVSQDQIAALTRRMEELNAELESGVDLSSIEQRLGELESAAPAVTPGELDSLNGKVATAVNRLDDLAGRVSALEEQPAEPASAKAVALVLAANELEEEVLAGLDYSQELQLVRELAGGDASVASLLAPLENAGGQIDTRQGLRQSFQQVLPEIIAAGYGQEQEDNLLSGVVERISRIVSVRPVGDVEGDGAAAVAARAEARLDNGDLAGAVRQLESLEGAPAEAAAGWLAAASARLAAEESLNELIAMLLRRQAGVEGDEG